MKQFINAAKIAKTKTHSEWTGGKPFKKVAHEAVNS